MTNPKPFNAANYKAVPEKYDLTKSKGELFYVDAVVIKCEESSKPNSKGNFDRWIDLKTSSNEMLYAQVMQSDREQNSPLFVTGNKVRCYFKTNKGTHKHTPPRAHVLANKTELLSAATDNQLKFEDVKPKTLNTQSEPEQLFLNMVLGKEPDGLRIMSQYMIPGLAYRPDFALINTITKEVILFIEIDGKQHADAKAMFNDHQRDQVILAETKIPILRLPASLVYATARHFGEIK